MSKRDASRGALNWLAIAAAASLLVTTVSTSAQDKEGDANPIEVSADKGATIDLPMPPGSKIKNAYLSPGGASLIARIPIDDDVVALHTLGDALWLSYEKSGAGRLDLQPTQTTLAVVKNPKMDLTITSMVSAAHGMYVVSDGRSVFAVDPVTETVHRERAVFNAAHRILEVSASDRALYILQDDHTVLALANPNLETPSQSLTLSLPYSTTGRMAFSDPWLFVADARGIAIIDTHDPMALVVRNHYDAPVAVHDLAFTSGVLVGAAGTQGLVALQPQEDGSLRWLGSNSSVGDARRIAVSDAGVAVANTGGQVLLVNLDNPALPEITEVLEVRDEVAALAGRGSHIIAASRSMLHIWDASAQAPRLSNDNLDAGEGVNFGGQRKGLVVGNTLFVADWFSGLHIYDISNPRMPHLLSSFHTPGSPKGVVVRDAIAYVADDDHGLAVIDVKQPTQPRLIAQLGTEGLAYTPVIGEDGLLYLASHRGGFQIIDISKPAAPRLLGEYDTPNKAWSIAVAGQTAYVADSESGLLVFDTNDKSAPRLVGRFSPGGNAEDVLIDGSIAYVAFFDNGVFALDISNPSKPAVLSHFATPGNARGLEKIANDLFVADWFGGIRIVGVSDPSRPSLRGSFDTPGAAWGLRVKDDFAYVFDWWGGLQVVNIADRSTPRLAGAYNQNTAIQGMAARGRYLFAAQGERGLQIFDVNNPLNPTWTTGLEIGGFAYDVALTGNTLLVAAGDSGLLVIDTADPFRPVISGSVALPYAATSVFAKGNHILVGDEQGGISSIDIEHPITPRLITRRGLDLVDATAFDSGVAGITANRQLVEITGSGGAQRVRRWDLGYEPDHIAAAGGWIAVAGNDNQIRFYPTPLTAASPTAVLALPDGARRLASDHQTLYVALRGGGVTAVDMRDALRPTIKANYPTSHPVTALLAQGQHLYGGGTALLALRPLPNLSIDTTALDRLVVSIPASLPEGSYDLLLDDQKSTRLQNRIAIRGWSFGNRALPPPAR